MSLRFLPILFFAWLCACQIATFAQESGDPAAAGEQQAATEPDPQAEAAAEIEAAIQSYVAAFNGRDAATLAAHWAPEGVYTSRTTGEQVVGRDAITAEFTQIFGQENIPGLAVSTESIEFISPSVALERGTAVVSHSEEDMVETSYSVVYIKLDGKWLIDRVTEDEIVVQMSNSDKLQPLDWMIGEWIDESEIMTIEINCQWTRNQNYISRTFKVTGDEIESAGMQIIGWDPVNNQIRSWLFDTDGSYVSGTWTKGEDQDRWVVQSVATLVDGSQGSYTSILEPLEDGSYSWRKVNRVLDGELLPSLDEVIVQRK
ncbi:MAG: YybH family protein [Pirellulaceae bacterium]